MDLRPEYVPDEIKLRKFVVNGFYVQGCVFECRSSYQCKLIILPIVHDDLGGSND